MNNLLAYETQRSIKRTALQALTRIQYEANLDHNPFLRQALQPPSDQPAKGGIELAQSASNLVWQSRAAPPTDYECRLGDALEQVFAEGLETLAEVVSRLNALEVRRPDGGIWDEASFQSEIKRLGA